MANIDIVAGGAGLNGTWARDLGREFTPAERSKAAKGRDPESNPMNVAERRRQAKSGAARRGRENARRRVCYGARHNVIEKNPCTNDPRGDAEDVPDQKSRMGSFGATARSEKP